MLPKKIIIIMNVLAIKLVLSQTVYTAAPTCTYSTNTIPTAQSFPTNVSPSATVTTLPASTVTATPMTASAVPVTATVVSSNIPKATIAASTISMPIATIAATIPISSVSSMPAATLSASPMPCSTVAASYVSSPVTSPKSSSATEVKAYFLPAPVPDPKVTVLAGDMPSIVEVKPRLADPGVIEVKPSRFAGTGAGVVEVSSVCADPSYIEVTGTFCPDAIKTGNVQGKTMSSTQVDNSPMTPVKRLATACANDDPFKSLIKSPCLPNQQPVCPGTSKIDLIPTVQKAAGNPIDFDGLLDSFMTCL